MGRDVSLVVGSTGAPVGGAFVSSPLDLLGLTESVSAVKVTGAAGRDLLVYDTYRPTNATAGITSQYSDLTDYNSSTVDAFTFSTPATITDKIIYGIATRGCNNMIFKNCAFVGPRSKPGTETALVNCNDTTYGGWEFYDCTFAPRFPNPNTDGIKSNNFKLFRCHFFHMIDAVGIFSNNASPVNGSTDVEVAGCLMEDHCYHPGQYFANASPAYLTAGGTYATSGTFVSRATAQPGDVPFIDNGHDNGNHSDGIQVQGGFGRMTRIAGGKWSGDGIYLHGNAIYPNDAVWNDGHGRDPSGKGFPIPGEAGSFTGSRLGFGDNPSRGTPQAPGMTRPVVNGAKRLLLSGTVVPNGGYVATGSGIAVTINAPTSGPLPFPYPDATHPDDQTLVMQYNHIDRYNIGLNTQPHTVAKITYAFLHNTFGPNVYMWSSNTPSAASIYPERVYNPEKTFYANDVDGTDGMSTNTWEDPQNVWGRNGLPLINSGSRGGLRYN